MCLQCGRPRFDPWVGKTTWRREQLPTPVFWPLVITSSPKKKKKIFPISHSYPLAAFFSNDHIPVISDNHKKKELPMGISLYDCKMKRPSPPHHDIMTGGCPLFTLASDRVAIKWTVVYLEFWDRGRSKNSLKRYEKVCVLVTFSIRWSLRVNQITRVAFKKVKTSNLSNRKWFSTVLTSSLI